MSKVVILLGSTGHGSGAERVLEYLLNGARDRRDEIVLVSTPSSSVTTCARDLGYLWLPWASEHDGLRQNTQAFLHLIGNEGRIPQGDIVHAWHTRGLEWAWLLARRWSAVSAGTLHDDPRHELIGRVRRVIIRQSAERLDGVVAVSQALSRHCAGLGWQKPATVIPNGLPDAETVARRECVGPLRLGFMASGHPGKGVALLPDLAIRLGDLSLQWNLFGTASRETEGLLHSLCTRPNVRHFGATPLEEALSHIDVMVHLSTMFDPYPTVLLEAARAGLPAIATRTGGSAEIVDDGLTGLLIPPGDAPAAERAIRDLAGRPGAREDMGRAARLRFERDFRVERMVADYLAFWNGLRSSRS